MHTAAHRLGIETYLASCWTLFRLFQLRSLLHVCCHCIYQQQQTPSEFARLEASKCLADQWHHTHQAWQEWQVRWLAGLSKRLSLAAQQLNRCTLLGRSAFATATDRPAPPPQLQSPWPRPPAPLPPAKKEENARVEAASQKASIEVGLWGHVASKARPTQLLHTPSVCLRSTAANHYAATISAILPLQLPTAAALALRNNSTPAKKTNSSRTCTRTKPLMLRSLPSCLLFCFSTSCTCSCVVVAWMHVAWWNGSI